MKIKTNSEIDAIVLRYLSAVGGNATHRSLTHRIFRGRPCGGCYRDVKSSLERLYRRRRVRRVTAEGCTGTVRFYRAR